MPGRGWNGIVSAVIVALYLIWHLDLEQAQHPGDPDTKFLSKIVPGLLPDVILLGTFTESFFTNEGST